MNVEGVQFDIPTDHNSCPTTMAQHVIFPHELSETLRNNLEGLRFGCRFHALTSVLYCRELCVLAS